MAHESNGWRVNARSYKGAQGVAQIMPATAKAWGVDPWDPVDALDAAAKHMKGYYDTYRRTYDHNTSIKMAAAYYNGNEEDGVVSGLWLHSKGWKCDPTAPIHLWINQTCRYAKIVAGETT